MTLLPCQSNQKWCVRSVKLGTNYRKDGATREHSRVFQEVLSRIDGSEDSGTLDDAKHTFTVTISKDEQIQP